MANLVYAAVRKDGRVFYFCTREEIPEGWSISPERTDITDVMEMNRLSKEQALRMMNS